MDVHRQEYELTEMCETLLASHNGYRSWKRGGYPNRKRLTDAQLLALIEAIDAEIKGVPMATHAWCGTGITPP